MSDIPSFPYRLLWGERHLVSVANLTRQDGIDFLRLVPKIGIVTKTTPYPLAQANQALADLRAGRFEGVAVLVPGARPIEVRVSDRVFRIPVATLTSSPLRIGQLWHSDATTNCHSS
jgi:hypothetical protein